MATRISSEFIINDTTDDGFASRPDIGIDAQGNFVVVWNQFSSATDNGVLVRRFDNTGDPDGDLITVDSFTSDFDPVVAVASDGRFVVVWDDFGAGNDISAQIYESDGDLDVDTFQVGDDDDILFTSAPDIAMDPSNGDFVVTWIEENNDGDRSLVAQRFNIDGDREGDLITVATIDSDEFADGQFLADPAVAMDDSGDFVIVWEQDTQENDDNDTDILAKRYSSSGSVLDDTFVVNTEQENGQFDPDVATDSNGDFTIVWYSAFINQVGLTPDLEDGIYARQFNSNGDPRGDQFAVAAPDFGDGAAFDPAVAMDSSGDTLIVWQNFDSDNSGDEFDIFAQEYDSSGNAVGSPFRINDDDDIDGDQDDPAIAIDPNGDAVIVWQSDNTDTTTFDQDIFGQRVSISGSGSNNTGGDNSGGDDSDTDTDTDNNDNTGNNIVPDATQTGTNADEQLVGTADADLIEGLGGDDVIFGRQGADELVGGRGNDTIRGDGGSDTVTGGEGADQLFGNGGSDTINGNEGRDSLSGGGGSDQLFGGLGRDTLIGNGGNDFLSGGEDRDILRGGGGDDSLYGGAGNDILRGGGGTNFFDGDEGRDTLVGRRGSADTFAVIPGNGLDVIRNFRIGEDFLAFEDLLTAFTDTEFISDRRGSIVKVEGERVALIRGVDLSINVLFANVSTQLTREQILGTPTN